MVIDFDKIPQTDIPHFKGGDGIFHANMFIDEHGTKIMRGWLAPGATSGLHKHEESCEIIFITKGSGHAEFDGETFEVHAGECHYCPEGHTHRIMNDSSEILEFFATVPVQPHFS